MAVSIASTANVTAMTRTPADLGPAAAEFLRERHLATLATARADGTPHVVAVGFTWDGEHGLARVITTDGKQKVRNVERGGYASVTNVDGPRWLTLEGPATIRREPDDVRDAEERYALRYREPKPNPRRVVIEIAVRRVMGSKTLLG
ncbi:F420-dependent biliverdin reductase [Gordonia hankookensis]